MNWDSTYKIRDSVDIYSVDDEFIVAYFMNTRVQKKYKANDMVLKLFERIDGIKTAREIYDNFNEYDGINEEEFVSFMDKLLCDKLVSKKDNKHLFDDEYIERYSRQLNYFAEFLGDDMSAELAQQKIKNSVIGIIGCGSMGGNIAVQLAMAGVETFVLLDCDTVSESDCARHIFYDEADSGVLKIKALSNKLKEINGNIKTYISQNVFSPATKMDQFIDMCTFIVDAADEPYMGYTAKLLSEICVPQKIPHYICGGFDAHLASTGEIVIPYVTPCAACYATFFKEKLSNWVPERHPIKTRYNEIGGLPSMTLFSSSFAAIEIIKYIASLVDMNKNYKKRAEFFFDGMDLQYLEPLKNPECDVCGRKDKNV